MKKFVSALMTLAIMCASVPYAVSAEGETPEPEVNTYTVTFLDFDDNVWKTLTVGEGEAIDYSALDTTELHRYKGIYTEQEFSSWDITPETVSEDTTIHALSATATINLISDPQAVHYFTNKGEVSLEGCRVEVSVDREVTKMSGGKIQVVVKNEIIDITKSCEARPNRLEAAFADTNTAEVKIYPISADKPITSYRIYFHDHHGDANNNGRTDAVDAASILREYAKLTSDKNYKVSSEYLYNADVDLDGKITSNDAALVLKYYAKASGHQIPDWEELIGLK